MHLRLIRIASFLGAVLWALLTNPANAQQPVSPTLAAAIGRAPVTSTSVNPARNPAATLGEALRSLANRSGVAFLGRVDRIDRQPGVVIVTLSVLNPILGSPGPTYTLREWSGLWTFGRERYAVGQRALFFLHAPSAAGLSSPVDGQYGVVPLLPTTADGPALLDVRWLTTRLQRPTAGALADAGAISLADTRTVVAQRNSPGPIVEPLRHPLPAALRPAAAASR